VHVSKREIEAKVFLEESTCHGHLLSISFIPHIASISTLVPFDDIHYSGVHHDYIDYHQTRNEGVRILTIFLYLNDVEAGGGTNFPNLNIVSASLLVVAVIWI
jgi:prolyl 4-hydroxylase